MEVNYCLAVLGILCFLAEVEGGWYDQRFTQWLAEYRETVTKLNLDIAEIYPNWLENAKYVDQHNSVEPQYMVSLNAFAHKV